MAGHEEGLLIIVQHEHRVHLGSIGPRDAGRMIDEGQAIDEEPFTRTGDRLRRLRNRRAGCQKDSNQLQH